MNICKGQRILNGYYASNEHEHEHDGDAFHSCESHVTLSIVADINSASIHSRAVKMKNLLRNKRPEMSVMTIQGR
jgi:hypothetical protein